MISQKGDVSLAPDKTGMSISDSQPASGIATRYRLSARYYLGRCSRKWREHPRDSFLTYRRRKWPTHPPYRRVHPPPSSHEETSFFSSSTPPHFDVPSVYLAWCEVKDSLQRLWDLLFVRWVKSRGRKEYRFFSCLKKKMVSWVHFKNREVYDILRRQVDVFLKDIICSVCRNCQRYSQFPS